MLFFPSWLTSTKRKDTSPWLIRRTTHGPLRVTAVAGYAPPAGLSSWSSLLFFLHMMVTLEPNWHWVSLTDTLAARQKCTLLAKLAFVSLSVVVVL